MELDEIESEEQMLAALDEGDPELEADIRRALSREVDTSWSSAMAEWEHMEKDEYVAMVDHWAEQEDRGIQEVLHYQSRTTDPEIPEMLAPIPPARVEAELREQVEDAAAYITDSQRPGQRQQHRGIFQFATGQGPGVTLRPVYIETRILLADEPLSWVPPEKVLEILKSEGPSDAEWEDMDGGSYSSGWTEAGDYWRLEIDSNRLWEWATDMRTSYFSDMVDEGPEQAAKAFVEALQKRDPELAKKVKKAKFPTDVLADYAVAYFEDPEEGIHIIREAVGITGYEGTRGEVILEIGKDELRQLGLTQGRWWDGAPWKLVNLPVEELAYEGTLMRHCVGRFDMGYREAVERGTAQIWSLRSARDKPILTFEIDAGEWDAAGPEALGMALRGGAIEQLKGKLNRKSGMDPAEARVLFWIFRQLWVDPAYVRDFVGSPSPPPELNPGFDRPWRPYHERRYARLMRWG